MLKKDDFLSNVSDICNFTNICHSTYYIISSQYEAVK